MNKELRKLSKALEDQGFETQTTERGHLRVFLDGVWISTFAGTPSDRRAFRNSLAPLKRVGFQWPPNR